MVTFKTAWLRASPIVCLGLLTTLLSAITAHAGVTIEFLATSPQWSTTEKEAVFYVKATGGTVSSFRCWLNSLNPERGDPAPRDAFECKAPDNLTPGAVGQLFL